MSEPKSLQEAILYFSNPDNCLELPCRAPLAERCCLPDLRLREGLFQRDSPHLAMRSHHAKRQFSVKVGTIFEDSPIGLDKWLAATWMLDQLQEWNQLLRSRPRR